jgi:hypothetical protein
MTATARFRAALRHVRDALTAPAVRPDHAPSAAVRDYPVARPVPRRQPRR